MSDLAIISFSGASHTGSGLTDPVDEIWACTLAMSVEDTALISQGSCDVWASLLTDWFTSPDMHIADTESLDLVKFNLFSLATGHQITDPTISTNVTAARGVATSDQPLSTTYRVSLDNGTRNPRAKGGFFPPRSAWPVGSNGRVSIAHLDQMVSATHTLLDGINAAAGSQGAVGVWSRADKTVHVSTRFRIGDVPDNISRRRNRLRETYHGVAL